MLRLTKDVTKEQLFQALVDASSTNALPSRNSPGQGVTECAYRTPDGRACVIGAFLPDEVAALGDRRGDSVKSAWADFRPHLPDWMDSEMAQQLQCAHDTNGDEESWSHKRFVRAVAKILGVAETATA